MDVKKSLFVMGCVGMAVWSLGGKYLYAAKRLLFRIKSFSVTNVTDKTANLNLFFLCQNPTGVEVYINDFDGILSFNGRTVSEIKMAEANIYPKSVSSFAITAVIDMETLTDELKTQLYTGDIRTWRVAINGNLFVSGCSLPVNWSYGLAELGV